MFGQLSQRIFFQSLTIFKILIGEYGVVYKGLLKRGTTDEVVAVKSLKGTLLFRL